MGASRGHRREQNTGFRAHSVPGAAVVIGVFVALFILFLWLHFIVAHENELIGREIQAQTEEMAQVERQNMALRRQITATCAEPAMAARARALGYRPQQPLYLLLSRPLAPAAHGSRTDALPLPFAYRDVPSAGTTANPAPDDLVAGAEGDNPAVTSAGRP